jgi:hypothetical protein
MMTLRLEELLHVHGLHRVVHEWRRAEVHAEAFAPDRYRAVFRQVGIRRQFIILIAHVSFQGPDIDEARFSNCVVVFGVGGGDEIDVHVRTIRRGEVCQPERFLSVWKLENRGSAFCLMRAAAKLSGGKFAGRGGRSSGKLFVDGLVDE